MHVWNNAVASAVHDLEPTSAEVEGLYRSGVARRHPLSEPLRHRPDRLVHKFNALRRGRRDCPFSSFPDQLKRALPSESLQPVQAGSEFPWDH